jgi:hypothetical protein
MSKLFIPKCLSASTTSTSIPTMVPDAVGYSMPTISRFPDSQSKQVLMAVTDT